MQGLCQLNSDFALDAEGADAKKRQELAALSESNNTVLLIQQAYALKLHGNNTRNNTGHTNHALLT